VTTTLARRRLLTGVLAGAAGGIAAAALAGCDLPLGADEPGVPAAEPDPLEPLLTGELALLASYDAAIAKFPSTAGRLRPLRADHAAHVQALRARMDPRRAAAAPESVVPSPAVAATAAAAVSALAAAERAAADRAGAACLTASGERAALLASIAACEATHLVVIG
jgi:hypothetical protein